MFNSGAGPLPSGDIHYRDGGGHDDLHARTLVIRIWHLRIEAKIRSNVDGESSQGLGVCVGLRPSRPTPTPPVPPAFWAVYKIREGERRGSKGKGLCVSGGGSHRDGSGLRTRAPSLRHSYLNVPPSCPRLRPGPPQDPDPGEPVRVA